MDATFLGDVAGTLVIPAAMRARVGDLPGWVETPLAHGLVLLEAADQTPWLEEEVPEPVLTRARHDLAPLLLGYLNSATRGPVRAGDTSNPHYPRP